VLAIDAEIRIEKAAFHRNILNHSTTKEGRGGTGTEHVLHIFEALGIGFVPTAVEVTHCGSKKDSGGIDPGFRQLAETGADRKKFSANSAGSRIGLARAQKHADKA